MRKSSSGAVAAVQRAGAHIAKAILELRQAARELDTVRGLGRSNGMFMHDVGVFKVLIEFRERLHEYASRPDAYLRLVSETPEEN